MPLPTGTRKEIEAALAEVVRTQTAFWDALGELEALSGRDLESTSDYDGYTVEDVLGMGQDEDEEEG